MLPCKAARGADSRPAFWSDPTDVLVRLWRERRLPLGFDRSRQSTWPCSARYRSRRSRRWLMIAVIQRALYWAEFYSPLRTARADFGARNTDN